MFLLFKWFEIKTRICTLPKFRPTVGILLIVLCFFATFEGYFRACGSHFGSIVALGVAKVPKAPQSQSFVTFRAPFGSPWGALLEPLGGQGCAFTSLFDPCGYLGALLPSFMGVPETGHNKNCKTVPKMEALNH